MPTIFQGAASVKYHTLRVEKCNVIEAAYAGPIDASSLVRLRSAVVTQERAHAYVVRMEKACLLMSIDPLLPPVGDYKAIGPGVVVCRPDQLEVIRAYAKFMSERGVLRAIFLESELEQARNFASFCAVQAMS